MTNQADLFESCRAIPRLVEGVKYLVIFNLITFNDFTACKITPPNFLKYEFVDALP